jgi:hypothetical protein
VGFLTESASEPVVIATAGSRRFTGSTPFIGLTIRHSALEGRRTCRAEHYALIRNERPPHVGGIPSKGESN